MGDYGYMKAKILYNDKIGRWRKKNRRLVWE